MDIYYAKSIVLVTLFLVTLISCLIPLKLVNTIRNMVDPAQKLRFIYFCDKFGLKLIIQIIFFFLL